MMMELPRCSVLECVRAVTGLCLRCSLGKLGPQLRASPRLRLRLKLRLRASGEPKQRRRQTVGMDLSWWPRARRALRAALIGERPKVASQLGQTMPADH